MCCRSQQRCYSLAISRRLLNTSPGRSRENRISEFFKCIVESCRKFAFLLPNFRFRAHPQDSFRWILNWSFYPYDLRGNAGRSTHSTYRTQRKSRPTCIARTLSIADLDCSDPVASFLRTDALYGYLTFPAPIISHGFSQVFLLKPNATIVVYGLLASRSIFHHFIVGVLSGVPAGATDAFSGAGQLIWSTR